MAQLQLKAVNFEGIDVDRSGGQWARLSLKSQVIWPQRPSSYDKSSSPALKTNDIAVACVSILRCICFSISLSLSLSPFVSYNFLGVSSRVSGCFNVQPDEVWSTWFAQGSLAQASSNDILCIFLHYPVFESSEANSCKINAISIKEAFLEQGSFEACLMAPVCTKSRTDS